MRKATPIAIVMLLLAGCGTEGSNGTESAAQPGAAAVMTTTTAPPLATTTVAATGLSAATPGALETELTTDLRYHPGVEPFQSSSGVIDVIAPTSEGPWPTVVVFHGDPRTAGKNWHRPDAQLIAEQGRVVFLPAWGHGNSAAIAELGTRAWWDLLSAELTCAVAFARSNAEQFGGDSDHITLYGLSAGGNAVLMAGLSGVDPLDNCTADGPAVVPRALVPIDADWVLGGGWDTAISEDPETFYALTPWRFLDGSQDVLIHVAATENTGPEFVRSVQPDPATSWLSYRHADIDLVADLEERGFLADGDFGLKESSEYAYQVVVEAGYDASFVLLPGASHTNWGTEGTAVVVDTVLNAAQR
jgi:hypothetical protein